MPTLTREDAMVLVCIRRLLAIWRGATAPPPALQHILEELKTMSDTISSELSRLRDDVAAQGTIIASATAAFRGLAAQLAAAEASARDAGATDAQVAGVAAVRQTLETNTASLAAAIPANTVPTDATTSNTIPATTDAAAVTTNAPVAVPLTDPTAAVTAAAAATTPVTAAAATIPAVAAATAVTTADPAVTAL